MFEFLRRLGRFLTSMDAKAMTSLGVSALLLLFVIVMFAYGRDWLHLGDTQKLEGMMARAAQSPLALIGVASIYVLLALTGFPQILLFTVTIIAFGPELGAIYAWIGTMVSATFTFGLGHALGGRWVSRISGERVQSMIDFLGRHAILASGLVRVVPSAPFIVVNAAAGAAHMPLWKFWVGSGVGIVPKIALVALIGVFAPNQDSLKKGVGGIVDFFTSRDPKDLAVMALLIPGWLGLLFAARWFYLRMRRKG
ncbi:MAG TPA: VTT domain-containing protein [Parvularculaceae bacterium]|nr:VTT domain-containing protein [Parvularculaceae bacterium]